MSKGSEMTNSAPAGLKLAKCNACGLIQYPPRELCCHCLADELVEEAVTAGGRLLSSTLIYYSLEPEQAQTTPNAIGLVKLDAGPTVFVRLRDMPALNHRMIVQAEFDHGGKNILYASSMEETSL